MNINKVQVNEPLATPLNMSEKTTFTTSTPTIWRTKLPSVLGGTQEMGMRAQALSHLKP